MEFNEQFYQNLFRLVASSGRKEAGAELAKLCTEVKQYYIDNKITDLWRPSFNANEIDVVSTVSAKKREKPVAPVAVKRETLSADLDIFKGPQQQQVPALKNAVFHSSSSSGSLSSAGTSAATSTKKDDVNVSLDHASNIFDADFSATSKNTAPGYEPLNLVANLEDNDDVEVLEISSKSIKEEELMPSTVTTSAGNIRKAHSTRTSVAGFTETSTIGGTLAPSATSISSMTEVKNAPKIRRLNPDARSSSPVILTSQKHEEANVIKPKASTPQHSTTSLTDDIACVVCKQLTFTLGNILLECHECHVMYHQKCHEPNVAQTLINDPRNLWYCNLCSKKIRRNSMELKKDSTETTTGKTTLKLENKDADKEKQLKLFLEAAAKRVEHKQNSAAVIKKPVASLAADFLAKHKNRTLLPTSPNAKSNAPSNAGATSAFSTVAPASAPINAGSGLVGLGKLAVGQQKLSTSTGPVPVTSSTLGSPSSSAKPKNVTSAATNLHAAEKRLQMMKKKAQASKAFK